MKGYAQAPSGAIDRARRLRRDATDAEKRLWRALRETVPAAKFRRQSPVGPFFADFLSVRHKLIVEVDGGQHAEAAEADARRTRYLEREGYTVIRFWHHDVLANTDGVLTAIALALHERGSSPGEGGKVRAPLPLPGREALWCPPRGVGEGETSTMNRTLQTAATIALLLFLAACARQVPAAVEHAAETPGFWWGLWHGFVFPFAWIGSLFDPDIAVYAVPNTGGWYDFGFFLGVCVLGGGSHFSSKKHNRA